MMFWIAVAVLVAGVTYAVTRPLLGQPPPLGDPAANDVAVYKDQLDEIDADVARGTLTPSEAESARADVARRLLRRTGAATQMQSNASAPKKLDRVFAAASVFLPVASLGLYLAFGAPGMPAQPLSERLAAGAQDASTADLIAKVEAALRTNPEDGKGWDVIAPVYFASGRDGDAALAYANAIRLLGETPQRLQGFADARIREDNGLVRDDVRAALKRILELDPARREPKIWLALAKEQDGDMAGAANDYRALLSEAPAGAPWRRAVEELLARASGGKAPEAGLSNSEIAAMSPEKREAMINEMVAGLAERLKSDKTDLAGWQKLIRAYQVLGRKDDAVKALAAARDGLAGDAAALAQLQNWAAKLGVSG